MEGLQVVLEAGDPGRADPVGARGRGRRKAADLVGRIGRDPDEDVAGWAGKKSRRDKLAAAAEGFGGWDSSPRN